MIRMIPSMKEYPIATVACFDPTCGELPRRSLDVNRLQSFLQRLSQAGAPAVLIAASTGQGHLRTAEELEEFFRAATAVDLGDTKTMALLRPEDGLETNRKLLQMLKDGSYDVVFFRPGTDLASDASQSQVVANLQPLIQEACRLHLPVGLYSISDVSGLPLTADAVAQLVDLPGGDAIVAVKVTEADYDASTLAFLEHHRLKHLKIVQGWDPHLARALRDGPKFSDDGRQRCGLTSGPMSLAVFQYLHILDAVQRQDWEEVVASQNAVTALFRSMQDDPTKFADLQRAKYMMGLGNPLLGEVTEVQVQRVLDAIRQLPRQADRDRLIRSLDLMGDGPYHETLASIGTEPR